MTFYIHYKCPILLIDCMQLFCVGDMVLNVFSDGDVRTRVSPMSDGIYIVYIFAGECCSCVLLYIFCV